MITGNYFTPTQFSRKSYLNFFHGWKICSLFHKISPIMLFSWIFSQKFIANNIALYKYTEKELCLIYHFMLSICVELKVEQVKKKTVYWGPTLCYVLYIKLSYLILIITLWRRCSQQFKVENRVWHVTCKQQTFLELIEKSFMTWSFCLIVWDKSLSIFISWRHFFLGIW